MAGPRIRSHLGWCGACRESRPVILRDGSYSREESGTRAFRERGSPAVPRRRGIHRRERTHRALREQRGAPHRRRNTALVLLAEGYCRSPLTPQSNAIRDRLKEQESRGAIDPGLQTAWKRLHQWSVSLNSMVLLAGCILIALVP